MPFAQLVRYLFATIQVFTKTPLPPGPPEPPDRGSANPSAQVGNPFVGNAIQMLQPAHFPFRGGRVKGIQQHYFVYTLSRFNKPPSDFEGDNSTSGIAPEKI